jgi:pyruvate/2-oxoglutarate dehydrogenase complex dihydrolipoamide dehydrogenase (E3) component
MGKYNYNLIAIGAGSAGLVTAYIGASVKAKVALIEKNKMGGDCLNTGCVPSKALLRSAKMLSYISRHKEFGLKSASAEFNFSDVMERVQNVILKVAPHDSVDRYTSLGVECFTGTATILSPHEVKVDDKVLTTKNIIIATGARPIVPSIQGMEKIPYLTTDTIWSLRQRPDRLLVVGGGPIGSELTQGFSRLGCNVIQIEKLDSILSREDRDISDIVCKKFIKEGIQLRVYTSLKEFKVENGKNIAVLDHGGKNEEVEFDQVLLALGRRPNTKGFGLENLDLELNVNGTLKTDEYLRTTRHSNVYACGDVAGPFQFTHTAAHQAWYCAVNALFSPLKKFAVDYSVIPWCTFTDPEVARVGLNEKEAREKGIPHEVAIYSIDGLDRAIVDEEDHGMVKVLTKPGKDQILGVTIVGYHAGDFLAEYVLAMKHGIGLNKILNTIHTYPTMAEANKYTAGVWKKNNAPKTLLKWVEKFHNFRRN